MPWSLATSDGGNAVVDTARSFSSAESVHFTNPGGGGRAELIPGLPR